MYNCTAQWNSTRFSTNYTAFYLIHSNHLLLSYGYRPRRSFLSRSRRIWARSRLGSWCPKPCQVSAWLPLSIWSLASSSWRDATFMMGTVVGRPWAHWKHRDVAFSSSIIRQHSDGSKGVAKHDRSSASFEVQNTENCRGDIWQSISLIKLPNKLHEIFPSQFDTQNTWNLWTIEHI